MWRTGMKTRFILIGYGWRADFFHRIAKELPEQFEITAAVLRTEERAKEVGESKGVFATADLEVALATKPDFAVLCVPRAITAGYLERLMEKQVLVLCETPPADSVEELNHLWEMKEKYQGRVQVAEQYFLQPLYAAILKVIEKDMLGEVSNMTLSALHGYHAISIFRKVLGVGFENCKIKGKKYVFPVVNTNGRAGFDRSGKVVDAERNVITLEFESGKVAFLDFASHQYFSHIRTRRLNVQGVQGEINDMDVYYLDQRAATEAYPNGEYIPVKETFNRIDFGPYNNDVPTHQGIMLGKEFLYENPFYGARFNDDEIAMADCLVRMKHYVETGEEFYSLKDALQDAYLSILTYEVGENESVVYTESQKFGK